ncbi:hypothetical protein C8J57DRAFT_1467301 [Mycena rebaudengoi]|nr:hypothetical protein C8J57DRAFT_1467301 [Mycena rebaudengoi]
MYPKSGKGQRVQPVGVKRSGDRPCLACVVARKEDDCKFDDSSQFSSTRVLIERARELEKLLHQSKQKTPDMDDQLGPSVLNELDQLRFASDPVPLTAIREDDNALASSNEAGPSLDPILNPDSSELLPVTNLGDSLDVAPNLSITTETEEEKLFRFRALFLQAAPMHGFSLSQKKLDAIAKGDMTGLVVHPVLVHVCHLWGCFLDLVERTGTVVRLETEEELTYMQLIQGSLNGMAGPTPSPATSILVYLTVSVYFFHKGHNDRGQEFLAAASKTAFDHDIDLAPLGNVSSREIDQKFSVLPSDDADETRAVFSHLIYIGTAAHLLVKLPLVLNVRLLDRFSLLLEEEESTQVAATHVDINFMRAKSLRLFAETGQLTSTWNVSASSPSPPDFWFGRYWKLIKSLHSHLGHLQPALLKVSFNAKYYSTELVLKLSTILALAALADLHAAFTPSHPESSRRYRDTLIKIVNVSSTFASKDFQSLTPILSVCWKVATRGILENRIVYQNQQTIIDTIQQCNQNLKQAFLYHNDFMPDLIEGTMDPPT